MQKILFCGIGNMGSAILQAAVSSGALNPKNTFIIDKNPEKVAEFTKKLGVQAENHGDCSVLILAVKPQSLESVFPLNLAENPLLISVLAGTSCEKLKEKSGISQICRVMPNTAARVVSGMSGMYFLDSVSEENKAFCQKIFSACGKTVVIDHEDEMHAVTAISGSGPAYFFQFVEHLAAAGEKLGLSPKTAALLAEQTFIGSAKLIETSKDSAGNLREKVTSPGGTTAAALKTFANLHFSEIVKKAVESAEKRSRELGA